MAEGFRAAFRGVRPVDWLIAGALTLLAVAMALVDITTDDARIEDAVAGGSMAHSMSTHTWWILPLLLVTVVPVLWWRRSVLAVGVLALVAMAVHDMVFGWVGRCGSGLPLAFVLTFLGALAYDRALAWLSLLLALLVSVAVLVLDSAAGPTALLIAVPLCLVVFGVGRATRHRAQMGRELSARNEELRAVRDQRAALEVGDDRMRISQQLDGLLQVRLDQLGRAADSAEDLDAAESRALLESIEADSRATLDDMREIVGLLRGGEVALAPTPTMAHLDALLARHTRADSRLTVSGDPRSLPLAVELSVYRIVEYLVETLADQRDSRIDVGVRFDDDALEIRVRGPVAKGVDVRAAAARARERAKLVGGSVELKVTRGQASAVAQLPILG